MMKRYSAKATKMPAIKKGEVNIMFLERLSTVMR